MCIDERRLRCVHYFLNGNWCQVSRERKGDDHATHDLDYNQSSRTVRRTKLLNIVLHSLRKGTKSGQRPMSLLVLFFFVFFWNPVRYSFWNLEMAVYSLTIFGGMKWDVWAALGRNVIVRLYSLVFLWRVVSACSNCVWRNIPSPRPYLGMLFFSSTSSAFF